VITCPKCSKENQDHYKFCLGCGAELPRGAAPKPFSPQKTPPHGVEIAGAGPGAAAPAPAPRAPTPVSPGAPPAPAASAPAPSGSVVCPQCGHNNAPTRFCASCGYNLAALTGGASAPAPAPAQSSSGAGASAAPAPAATAAAGSGVVSVTLTALRADGTEAGTWKLPDSPTLTVGRDTGNIFAGDSYLSPRHATFTRKSGQVSIKDEGSLNGVYLKIKPNEPWPLVFDDVFRIGQEIVRYEELKSMPPTSDGVERFGSPAKGYVGRLALVIGRDTVGNAFPIPERGVHLGRERGDILFSEDGYVSGLHCRIARASDGKIYLTDVGSSNGTFIRLKAERSLIRGDVLLMGQQLFRVDF
jgi:pSer/pThr/pTyr-binding forkhead associated (FHA) protein